MFLPLTVLAGELGARLVVSINNVSYSQRNVEMYIITKESLRLNQQPLLVDAKVWKTALNVFIEDMIILQETIRLGSFKNSEEVVVKFSKNVESQRKRFAKLDSKLKSLDANTNEIYATVDDVLRIVAYRQSKSNKNSSREYSKPLWLKNLVNRAVVRQFSDASNYQEISPSLATE